MKKIAILALLPVMLLCVSCKSKKQVLEKPDDLINRKEMVELIAESYLIESTVHLSPDTVNRLRLTRDFYKELFTRHHITREQFVRSIDYYIGEETSAEKLLTDASNRIAEMRKELNIPDTIPTPIDPNSPIESIDPTLMLPPQ